MRDTLTAFASPVCPATTARPSSTMSAVVESRTRLEITPLAVKADRMTDAGALLSLEEALELSEDWETAPRFASVITTALAMMICRGTTAWSRKAGWHGTGGSVRINKHTLCNRPYNAPIRRSRWRT